MDAARGRFSKEYTCPKDEVATDDLGGSAYRAQGCGQAATYVCTTHDGEEPACVKESEQSAE